jgi:hypothetical protein
VLTLGSVLLLATPLKGSAQQTATPEVTSAPSAPAAEAPPEGDAIAPLPEPAAQHRPEEAGTALALGNTSQRRLLESSALQSTVLAGVGYGAGGTINGAGERDYHYGLTPQMLVAFRLMASDRAAFDLTLRDYFISSIASPEQRGSENIARAEALISIRLVGSHAASVRYRVFRPELLGRLRRAAPLNGCHNRAA